MGRKAVSMTEAIMIEEVNENAPESTFAAASKRNAKAGS